MPSRSRNTQQPILPPACCGSVSAIPNRSKPRATRVNRYGRKCLGQHDSVMSWLPEGFPLSWRSIPAVRTFRLRKNAGLEQPRWSRVLRA